MAVNPLLKELAPINEMLPMRVNVSGIAYENRRVAASRSNVGDGLEFIRDFENPIDPNAVLVRHNAGDLGFLPWDVAQLIAPEMDSGAILAGDVKEITEDRIPQLSIEMRLAQS